MRTKRTNESNGNIPKHETLFGNVTTRRKFLLLAFSAVTGAYLLDTNSNSKKNNSVQPNPNSNPNSNLDQKKPNEINPVIQSFIVFLDQYKNNDAVGNPNILDPKVCFAINQDNFLIVNGEKSSGSIDPIIYILNNYDPNGNLINQSSHAIYSDTLEAIDIKDNNLPNELETYPLYLSETDINNLPASNVEINKKGQLVNENYQLVGVVNS